MSKNLNLHLIQWRILPGDVEGNLDRAKDLIASVSPGKGDLVLLPEMFPSAFITPTWRKWLIITRLL